jgi:hypothetical protein
MLHQEMVVAALHVRHMLLLHLHWYHPLTCPACSAAASNPQQP